MHARNVAYKFRRMSPNYSEVHAIILYHLGTQTLRKVSMDHSETVGKIHTNAIEKGAVIKNW